MKIAILLPYKENFSKKYAGAVSIFVNNIFKICPNKKRTTIYGSTKNKPLSKNYINIDFRKNIFESSSRNYLDKFLLLIKNKDVDLIEIHNRPRYVNYLHGKINKKKILYIHNDPIDMEGSKTINDRKSLLDKCDIIIFNSLWTKNRFLIDLPKSNNLYQKLHVVHQTTSKVKINFNKKKKIISFVGKLNSSKGFDIFGEAITKILDKYEDWSAVVIGNEPRQNLFFEHKRLYNYGFKGHDFILNKLKSVSISVVPSKWNEPFGRASLEASSRGCAVIRSNTGGLNETCKNAVILNKLTSEQVYQKIELLIKDKKFRNQIQKKTYKNFYLTNEYAVRKINNIRSILMNKILTPIRKKNELKIIHITNFNERFDGRLHYNTSKRLNNGFIRLGHNVLTISDRDIISTNRSIFDPKSIKILNKKIINNYNNFKPDIVIFGHADNVLNKTIEYLKNDNNNLKICQWFLDPLSKYGPDYQTNKKRILSKSKLIDTTFLTTDPKSLDFKINNAYFIPNPVDKSFEILSNYKKKCSLDVFFAMSHGVHRGKLKKGKHDDRELFLNKLIKNEKISFNIFGINNIQPIWGNEFLQELSKCRMGLNLSRGRPIKYYSSDRIAQLMGNGLLTFVHEKTCLSDFFNKNELITYKNMKDLLKKIYIYKKDDKKSKIIARNGKIKYHKYFNSTVVASYIIEKTLGIKSNKTYYWSN